MVVPILVFPSRLSFDTGSKMLIGSKVYIYSRTQSVVFPSSQHMLFTTYRTNLFTTRMADARCTFARLYTCHNARTNY